MSHFSIIATKEAGGESLSPTFQKGAFNLDLGFQIQAYRSWAHFDLSPAAGMLPQSAYLYLSAQTLQGTDGPTLCRVHRLTTTAWVELETTWNKASNILNWTTPGGDFDPAFYVEFLMTTSTGTDTQVIDILPLVSDALNNRGNQLHLLFKKVTESGNSLIGYKSKEGPFLYQAPRVELDVNNPRHLLETLDPILIERIEPEIILV